MRLPIVCFVFAALSVTLAARARAQGAEGAAPPPVPPAPYALPFGLRPIAAATAVRAETAYALDSGASSTVVQYLTASYAPVEPLSIFVRGGWVDFIPEGKSASTAFTNVAIGGLWSGRITPELRYAATLGTGLPVGQGGGATPNPGEAAAIAAGNLARSRFEGATMFSPNDVAPFVGGDVAWVSGGLTLQAEATLFELVRVTGAPTDPDASKTSLSMGADAGYFVIPELSVGVEVRDQSFLTTPAAVQAGKTARSWVTAGAGVRAHLRLGEHVWMRPGLAFFQPLNDPSPTISASSYHIFQLDIPVTF
jgi:hypothetical protein